MVLFSLDPASTRRRGTTPDVEITIPLQAVKVEDILSLGDELGLHATALEAAYLIAAKYKKIGLQMLLAQGDNLKEFAQQLGGHPESIAALLSQTKTHRAISFFCKCKSRRLPRYECD